jgi:hypothetical protein
MDLCHKGSETTCFMQKGKMFGSVICHVTFFFVEVSHVTIYMKPCQQTNLMKSNYCARGCDHIIHKLHIHYYNSNCLLLD